MTKTDHTKTNFATAKHNGSIIIIHRPAGATSEQLTKVLQKKIDHDTKEITGNPAKRWKIRIEG